MKRALAALALLALPACHAKTGPAEPAASDATIADACEPVVFDGTPLTHCTADPAQDRIRTDLAPPRGKPYRSLKAFADDLPGDAAPVLFAMNGGMFDQDGEPIGYYVEGGRRLHLLNRANGPGNFHMKPNGVFFGTGGKWQVLTTDEFARTVTQRPEFATQSGPMLVIGGELHEGFAPDGESQKIRNAVGVDDAGRAHFVISQAPISFGKLARYFRDVLKTPDALFLDGTVSQLWDPAANRMDSGAPLGPLIVVERLPGPVQPRPAGS